MEPDVWLTKGSRFFPPFLAVFVGGGTARGFGTSTDYARPARRVWGALHGPCLAKRFVVSGMDAWFMPRSLPHRRMIVGAVRPWELPATKVAPVLLQHLD